ncbi:MAG: hypothetical protein A2340_16095 [Lentisphaerae bacterium RIFOXYB12_FULL_60_10]|nr:MAG: hypothetical protein A2340_16095 [Lentisphaerae bacterium RIFOXYB12_FULL_60_10]
MNQHGSMAVATSCLFLIAACAYAEEAGEGDKVPKAAAPASVEPGKCAWLKFPDGIAYFLRVPASYDAKKGARLIVFLHGSNMNGLAYLRSFEAKGWCRDDILLCPNGEQGRDVFGANNFTFGSASPITDVVAAVKKAFKVTRTYIGGHSQGGFVTYSVIIYSAHKNGPTPAQ